MPAWLEKDRLAALERYEILDTPREQDFDDIVRLAAQICGTPIALITLVSKDRQWFKAAVGTTETETPRNIAFCNLAIMQSGVFEVTDTHTDPAFASNPLVTGEPHLRFYTSAVLETPKGLPLGTLCVLDTKPGKLDEAQKFALQTLANQVMDQLELRRIAREQIALRKTYENVLTNTPDLIYIIGLDKRFRYANNALLTMWGKTESEAFGKSLRELNYPEWHAAMHEQEIDEVVATKKPIRGEVVFPHNVLGTRHYDYIFSPIFGDDGAVTGIAGSTRDVTERKKMEEALRISEERRAIALHASDFIGTWDWDIQADIVTSDERFAKLFSVDPDEAAKGTNIFEFTKKIHPDDLDKVATLIDNAKKTGGNFSAEYRLIQADGVSRWVHASGKVYVDEHGAAVRFPGVAIDITERKLASDAAEEARRMAEEASAAKTDFLTNMSHEIRTPMNAVIGLANILSMSSPLTDKQKQYLSTLQLSADSLLTLISDLLDISKIEARSIELENIPFNPADLTREVLTMIAFKAREKSLSLTMNNRLDATQKFIGDPARLKQIILNLCSNAVKFTDKGEVAVVLDAEETTGGMTKLIIQVQDTGIGVAEEKQAAIFEKFTQADSSISRKYGGTGLGLTITKTLVEKMGGTLSMESTLGMGSCFTVEIPMMSNDGAASTKTTPEIQRQSDENVSARRVLLVDDHPANVMVASAFLERFGYSYDVALSGKEAVEIAKQKKFSAILMDVQMEGMSGYEATALIRMDEKLKQHAPVRIIGMTAHALAGDREKCLASGMDDYIPKPFNPEQLKSALVESNENKLSDKDAAQSV